MINLIYEQPYFLSLSLPTPATFVESLSVYHNNEWWFTIAIIVYHFYNSVPFLANVPFLYPLKTSENMWFSGGKKRNIGHKWVDWEHQKGMAKNAYGWKYSRMNQGKSVENSLYRNWSSMVCLSSLNVLKAVFQKFSLVHSWTPWLIYIDQIQKKYHTEVKLNELCQLS